MWQVEFRENFRLWLVEQPKDCRLRIIASVNLLKEFGPQLGRPYVDSVKGSFFSNMKELRIQAKSRPIRAFFVFDPKRKAIILCAGDKSNDKTFYERMIHIADLEYEEYLSELTGEKHDHT